MKLEQWIALDPVKAFRQTLELEKELREYLNEKQVVMTVAANVGVGKSLTVETLSYFLLVPASYELENDVLHKGLLSDFIGAVASGNQQRIQETCYLLQLELRERRLNARQRFYDTGKSFIEDRTPEEDNLVFYPRFLEKGFLSQVQYDALCAGSQAAYAAAPKSDVMILLKSSPELARRGVERRGRPEELDAWTLEELQGFAKFYDTFEQNVSKYQLHDGPIVVFDRDRVDPLNQIHRGFMYEEILGKLTRNL